MQRKPFESMETDWKRSRLSGFLLTLKIMRSPGCEDDGNKLSLGYYKMEFGEWTG